MTSRIVGLLLCVAALFACAAGNVARGRGFQQPTDAPTTIPQFASSVIWYRYLTSAGKYTDSSAIGTNDATDSGGALSPTWVSASEGMYYDGGDGSYCSATPYNGAVAMTWAAWFKVSNVVQYAGIANTLSGTGNKAEGLIINYLGSTNNVAGFNTGYATFPTTTWTTGEWCHAALTWAVGDTGRTLYINGVSNAYRLVSPGSVTNAGLTRVGYFYDGVNTYRFNGNVDDVLIYTQKLTDAEVLQLYNFGH